MKEEEEDRKCLLLCSTRLKERVWLAPLAPSLLPNIALLSLLPSLHPSPLPALLLGSIAHVVVVGFAGRVVAAVGAAAVAASAEEAAAADRVDCAVVVVVVVMVVVGENEKKVVVVCLLLLLSHFSRCYCYCCHCHCPCMPLLLLVLLLVLPLFLRLLLLLHYHWWGKQDNCLRLLCKQLKGRVAIPVWARREGGREGGREGSVDGRRHIIFKGYGWDRKLVLS